LKTCSQALALSIGSFYNELSHFFDQRRDSEISAVSKILIAFVALEHCYILWLEMFAWTTRGKRVFTSIPSDLFERTKVLAANQGLYNGFLAAGLVWSLVVQDAGWSKNIALFFLSCIIVAGIYGGASAHKSIFYKQALPAIAALIVLLW
jgi:putative membrane protein